MSWLKLGLFGSIIFVLYYYQQIKMTLKERGYEVDLLTGWIDDYEVSWFRTNESCQDGQRIGHAETNIRCSERL